MRECSAVKRAMFSGKCCERGDKEMWRCGVVGEEDISPTLSGDAGCSVTVSDPLPLSSEALQAAKRSCRKLVSPGLKHLVDKPKAEPVS